MKYAFFFASSVLLPIARADTYLAESRWGQATLLLDNILLIHGGKTDSSGGQSYSSAPDTNEVLYLDLSSGFDTSSTPWQLVSGSSNDSSTQAPALAWHTINALNSSHALVFGGTPDANGQPPVHSLPDSAGILNAFSRINPSFTMEASDWAGQPIRRIHHSAVSTSDGRVWIIGGEKPDEATYAYSDNYVFDVGGPSFTQLTSGLPDVSGHCATVLPNGNILVLGGYSPSTNSLLDLSGVYVMDTTQTNPSWTRTATTGSAPGGRRGFACTLFNDKYIYIHGGSDGSRQSIYSDGFVLDISQPTWTWNSVSSLTDLGPRTEHFAAAYGNQIVFGFGYGSSGPASSTVSVFQPSGNGGSSGSWTTTFTPPAIPITTDPSSPGTIPTQTVPHGSSTGSSGPGHPTGTHTGTTIHTPTQSGGLSPPPNDNSGGKNTAGIAVGSVLGFCAAAVFVGVIAYRVHQRRKFRRQFMAVGEGDDGFPPAGLLPAAGPRGEKSAFTRRHSLLVDDPTQPGITRDIIAAIGVPAFASAVSRAVHTSHNVAPERRDMLADEDTRDFGGVGPWYARRQGSGTGGSSWSLRSILPGRMRREGSTSSSVPASPWVEKGDPFGDGAALMRDTETGYVGAMPVTGASRPPHSRRQSSYASTVYSYADPFADPFADPQQTFANVPRLVRGASYDSYEEPNVHPYRRPLPVLEGLATTGVPFQMQPHTLSPLTEASSRGTLAMLSDASSSSQAHRRDNSSDKENVSLFGDSSHGHESGVTASSRVTSLTSLGPSSPLPSGVQSPLLAGAAAASGPRLSSMIDANPQGAQVRRSDTWWARLSKRRKDNQEPTSPTTSHMFEFRDPHPPPTRLGAIAEANSQASQSPDESPQGSSITSGHVSRHGSYKGPTKPIHGKSTSSLRTLDSAAIAQMGNMEVAQRVATGSIRTHQSTGSYDTHDHAKRASTYSSTDNGSWLEPPGEEDAEIVNSPIDMTSAENPFEPESVPLSAPHAIPLPASQPSTPQSEDVSAASSSSSLVSAGKRPRPPSGAGVAARVQAYERKFSTDAIPPPTNTRQREERKDSTRMTYGLVPRPTLYLANPDKKEGSGDS